ncbi:MAG: IS3 family transposase [Candidatus Omnitrophica bacterium]|nr:IS3 family transposase [Candidatus Omnitrophota bacterium]
MVDHGAKEQGISISMLCDRVGMSRQNYYAARRQRQRRQIDEELVVELVKEQRRVQPRIGSRKLLYMLQGELAEAGVRIGRDRFIELLGSRDLLVERKRVWPKTTNSRHSLPVFRNLLKEREPTAPNQVWVSDLTYIRTEEGYMYASLITDMCSRKIVGFHVGDSLESMGCQKALEMALEQLPSDRYPIHHSDRGCQYCCHEYVQMLKRRWLSISMTEENHCYENAMAERVNGILKQEYALDTTFCTKEQAIKVFVQAVELYNNKRPHLSLDYRTPEQVHRRAA